VEVVFLDRGPASIESEYEEALAAPDTICKAVEAEADGSDAVIIDCMLDPGLPAVREKVAIPVIGPGLTSMHFAAMLGDRFSVVTIVTRLAPALRRRARAYGLSDRLASVRAIDLPVLELERDQQAAVPLLLEQATLALEQDGADVVVLGCTGMAGLAKAVHKGLGDQGHPEVPVIDPGLAALKQAEVMVDLKLTHSKRTYPLPPRKTLIGFPSL
jgi:allantoin racemase